MLAGALQHDDADIVVGHRPVELAVQVVEQLPALGVVVAGPVQGENRDRAAPFVANLFCCHILSSAVIWWETDEA